MTEIEGPTPLRRHGVEAQVDGIALAERLHLPRGIIVGLCEPKGVRREHLVDTEPQGQLGDREL